MSYDNERSVALKAEFAFDAGLAGVNNFIIFHLFITAPSILSMTWSIDTFIIILVIRIIIMIINIR